MVATHLASLIQHQYVAKYYGFSTVAITINILRSRVVLTRKLPILRL